MFPFNDSYIKKIRSVRPDRLVALFPHNEPLGHAVSTEVIRGYHGAYTAVTLGQTGLQGTGMTSAGYDGATSFNNIYTAGFANDNLFGNPGFETAGAGDPDFWAVWEEQAGDGVLANEAVVVHEGNDACKQTTGLGLTIYVSNDWVSVPNTTYRVRFWTQGDGANSGLYRVRDVTNAAYVTDLVDTGITAAAYGMYEFEVTAPAGCVLMRLYLHGADVNGAVTYFDACEVRRTNGFLGDKGTVLAWIRLPAAAWVDDTSRRIVTVEVDGNNRLNIGRSGTDTRLAYLYVAGGVVENVSFGTSSPTTFVPYGMTWDRSAGATGEVRAYYLGAQITATQVGLGTWLGDLSATKVVIGAQNTVPAAVFHGDIGPVPVWSEALSPDEMRYLG